MWTIKSLIANTLWHLSDFLGRLPGWFFFGLSADVGRFSIIIGLKDDNWAIPLRKGKAKKEGCLNAD